jgi:hypothetical protein
MFLKEIFLKQERIHPAGVQIDRNWTFSSQNMSNFCLFELQQGEFFLVLKIFLLKTCNFFHKKIWQTFVIHVYTS